MNRLRLLLGAVGVTVLSVLLAVPASAQCGALPKHIAYPVLKGSSAGSLHLAAAAQTAGVVDDGWHGEPNLEPIVGLWKMDFEDTADGYSDKGYSVWHSDHTEFMNSTRPPSTGAVCQGVWEKAGRSTYKLNHFALGYADGTTLTAVYQFKEIVTVNPAGNKFTGVFSIQAFDPKTHAALGTFKGTVTGEKVNINTTIDSQNF